MSSIGFHLNYRNIKRLRQIGNVLIKHGLGYVVGQLNISPVITWARRLILWHRQELDITPESLAVRTRFVLEELGPSFVKFGQMISSRPDLVPVEFAEQFKKLQDEVPPFSFQEVRQVIENELNAPLNKLYRSFEPTSLAAASIAQVHRAELHDGQKVIVKVQRPGIRQTIERDIELLFYFARLLEKQIPEVRLYRPVGIAEEFSRSIRREQDFMLEANSAQRIKDNFEGDPTVYIPKVFWALSSSRVLTMERVEGIPVDELEQLEAAGCDLKVIAKHGCEAFLRQIFEHGFFHADPHPGNILVGEDNCIYLLDFGLMGHLDEQHMTHIANVLFALTDRDYDRLVHEYLMLGFATGETNVEDFKRDIIDFYEPYYGQTLKNIPIGTLFSQGMQLMAKHKVQTPVDLILLAKTFVFVESIGRQLDLDFNLIETARPYASSLLKKRMHPKRLATLASKNLSEMGEMIKFMPRQIQLILRKLLLGELQIGYIHTGLEPLIKERRRSSKEMSIALVIAALVISSTLLIQSDSAPIICGISLGLLGFGLVGILSVFLVYSMLRK